MMIEVVVNGKPCKAEVPDTKTLLSFIRDDLGLTGTKEGCGYGECGACTILLDGKAVNSCLLLAAQVDGHCIETIEGLADDRELAKIQKSFLEHDAVQCGFCTPGMIMSAAALLKVNPHPSEEEVRDAIKGNICRCTGYKKIIEAAMYANENQ